jgi:OmpA-OmpF porin, OOP family
MRDEFKFFCLRTRLFRKKFGSFQGALQVLGQGSEQRNGKPWTGVFMLSKCLTNSRILVLAAVVFGCAQGTKVTLPIATIDDANKLQTEVNIALTNHLDVLAYDEFTQAQKFNTAAQEGMRDGDDSVDIVARVKQGRDFLRAGYKISKVRRPLLEGVIKTRQMAIEAGVRNYPKYLPDFEKIDEDVRDEVVRVNEMTPQLFSKLQSRYMECELNSIKANNLEMDWNAIEKSKDENRGNKVAPKTFKQAEIDLRNAENMINANRGRPENYKESVEKAHYSTQLLIDTVTAATENDKNLDEDTALNIVFQNRKINNLQGKLGQVEKDKQKLGLELEDQSKKVSVASAAIRIQKAMESARKSFTKQEAEVYQQGDHLLIRLKTINFKSGGADLPGSSFGILAKVKKVALQLGPQQIVIEGHTDSYGDAASNDQLSQARAEAVAHYFETNGIDTDKVRAVGYGFKKPIASNKTKLGRAQNRRVDVIITPSGGERRMAHDF